MPANENQDVQGVVGFVGCALQAVLTYFVLCLGFIPLMIAWGIEAAIMGRRYAIDN